MRKLVIAFLIVLLSSAAALSQQTRPQARRRNAAPAIEDVVLGFYVSQFQQVAAVNDEVFAKVLPFLRQFVHDRFEISTRRTRALNQLRIMAQRNDSDEDLKRTIREVDSADTDLLATHEKFLANVDPLLTPAQQAKVRIFQSMSDQRIRQMLDRIQNAGANRQPPAVSPRD